MASLGALIARNPMIAGGSTAFLVAFCYVSANAIWYQPHIHRSALFATRDFVRPDQYPQEEEPETTFLIERPQASPPAPVADRVAMQVQDVLKQLGHYQGAVDGLPGPATTGAIQTYRQSVGLPDSGSIDEALLMQLGITPTTSGIVPQPAPRGSTEGEAQDQTALTKKVQAGLKAFGNDGVEIDGILGSRTRSAIREFESIFGLPVTGEPNPALYAKMREIGLTN
ncbi:peptidoglycan-binding domain-containing protein [Pseudaminobacter soli (ex Zhang et al. 2022)]